MSELTIKLESIDPIEFLGFNNAKFKVLKKAFNKLNIVARGNKIIAIGNQEDLDEFGHEASEDDGGEADHHEGGAFDHGDLVLVLLILDRQDEGEGH